MDNKNRIQELRRKSQRTYLCKEWERFNVQITMDDFLEVQDTLRLQDKILSKLDEMDNDNTSIIYQGNEKDMIFAFQKMIIHYIEDNDKYVFFVKDVNKIGGLVLNGKTISENYQFIVKESEFFNKGCSIFFCSLNMDKGICLWKGEYDTRFYFW